MTPLKGCLCPYCPRATFHEMSSNVYPHLYQSLSREEQQVSPHSEEHLPLVGAGDPPSLTQLRRPPLSHTAECIYTQMLHSDQPSLRGTQNFFLRSGILLKGLWPHPMRWRSRYWRSALWFLACWINKRTTDNSVQWGTGSRAPQGHSTRSTDTGKAL